MAQQRGLVGQRLEPKWKWTLTTCSIRLVLVFGRPILACWLGAMVLHCMSIALHRISRYFKDNSLYFIVFQFHFKVCQCISNVFHSIAVQCASFYFCTSIVFQRIPMHFLVFQCIAFHCISIVFQCNHFVYQPKHFQLKSSELGDAS